MTTTYVARQYNICFFLQTADRSGGYHHHYHYSDQPRGHYPGPSSGYEKTFVGNRRVSEPYGVIHQPGRLRAEREEYLQDSEGYPMDSAESDHYSHYEREMHQVYIILKEYYVTLKIR